MKRILSFLPICFILVVLIASNDPSEVLQHILRKLKQYHTERPQEKLYFHFDKPFYAAGDSIWFKAYLVEASLHSLDSQSRVVYAELVDSAHNVIQRRVLLATGGLTHGDFALSTNLHQGKYLIRAYTNYMKNAGEDYFFYKEFNILNPEKDFTQLESTRIFNPDSIDLQFFPEGGNLVACGKPNRIAFKAMSPDGKGFPAEGYITDNRDSIITPFTTAHDGMGVFQLNPHPGRKYYAQIVKPYSVNKLYELPAVQETGVSIQVSKTEKFVKVIAYTSLSTVSTDLHLVVQSRGKVYHAQSGSFSKNSWFTYIPRAKLPHGISQITLFDASGRPLAERLMYQNQDEYINVSIKTDTATYGARQQVIVYTDALYQNGVPAKGSFSISVYDDKLLKTPEQYPINIHNYLSLTSDLKGHIENPGYYFKDTLDVTERHLDLLMMIQGWSRFTWQDILDDDQQPQLFSREKGIPIGGRVVKAYKDKLVQSSTLKLLSLTGQATVLKPDSLGYFYTDALLFYDTIDLVARTENARGKRQPYKFRLQPLSFPPVLQGISAYIPFDASQYVRQQAEQRTLLKLTDVTQFDELVVTAKRIEERQFNPWGKIIDMRKKRYQYYTMYDLLQDNVKGLSITGEHPNVIVRLNGKVPVFRINGKDGATDIVGLYFFKAQHVDMIETSKTFIEPNKYPQDIINLMVKSEAFNVDIIGMNQVKYAGFYKAREFYAPRYDVPETEFKIPDKRTTLFWEPMLQTDENGRAAVSFYTADVASRYRIVIEGITPDGYPGTASTTFEVK